jgi:hypothetical protein
MEFYRETATVRNGFNDAKPKITDMLNSQQFEYLSF